MQWMQCRVYRQVSRLHCQHCTDMAGSSGGAESAYWCT
ncbi:MAG: hypothetical protein RJA10_37 [Pseudomonadota bacterium]